MCDFWFYGTLKDLEFTIKNERNLTDLKGVKKGAQTHKATGRPEPIDADGQLLHCS